MRPGAAAGCRPKPSGSTRPGAPTSAVYPWGDAFDIDLANVVNSTGPKPVGELPRRRELGGRAGHGRQRDGVGIGLARRGPRRQARRPIRPARRAARIKVEKGGWWGSNEFVARSAYRHYEDPPTYGDHHIGFRIASQ